MLMKMRVAQLTVVHDGAAGLDIEPLETSEQKPLHETTFDANRSESTPGSDYKSAFVVVGDQVHSFRRHLRSLRHSRSRKYVTAPAVREPPGQQRRPLISEPGPVDFSQYGMVARMWMEQVDDCLSVANTSCSINSLQLLVYFAGIFVAACPSLPLLYGRIKKSSV